VSGIQTEVCTPITTTLYTMNETKPLRRLLLDNQTKSPHYFIRDNIDWQKFNISHLFVVNSLK
jgi:hypothetical protein